MAAIPVARVASGPYNGGAIRPRDGEGGSRTWRAKSFGQLKVAQGVGIVPRDCGGCRVCPTGIKVVDGGPNWVTSCRSPIMSTDASNSDNTMERGSQENGAAERWCGGGSLDCRLDSWCLVLS